MTTDTPDVLALREAARLVSQWADAVDPMPDELRAELRDLRALIPAVRAETLAGSGVSVDVTVHPEARCDRHPLGCRPSDRAATPPTPALCPDIDPECGHRCVHSPGHPEPHGHLHPLAPGVTVSKEHPPTPALTADRLAALEAALRSIAAREPAPASPGCTCDPDSATDDDGNLVMCDLHEPMLRHLRWESLASLVIDYQAFMRHALAVADAALATSQPATPPTPALTAALPEYITASVLDQWEESAKVDLARGAVWSVNPVTLLNVLPVLRAALATSPAPAAEVEG